MNRFRYVGVLAAAAVAAVAAGSALAVTAKPTPFKAAFTGKAVVKVNGQVADITATGAGVATLLRKSKLTAKGAGTQSDPCPLFGGIASMTGTGGKINFKIPPAGGSGCTDEEANTFALVGRATITGGTLKYRKAKGTFKFTGTFDKGTGNYSVQLHRPADPLAVTA